MVLLTMAAAVFLSSNPQVAYADTPTYDAVFYYYHPDHLGSCQLMTDRNGELVQQYGYTPFGEENYQNNTSAFDVSSRYTGQTLDEDTGLYYYGARYYDPELARFVQADSTVPDPEFSQAYNRYAYVYNNPLNFSDPTGQFPWLVIAAVAISGGVAAATGGNPIQAMAMTALGMALYAGIGGVISQMGVVGPVTTAVIAGAATGAIMGAVSGGNPLVGAAVGAASAWLVRGVFKIDPGCWDAMLQEQAFGEWMGTQVVSLGVGCVQGASPESMLCSFGGDAIVQVATYWHLDNDPKNVSVSPAPRTVNTGDRSPSSSGLQKAAGTALLIAIAIPGPVDDAVVLGGIAVTAGAIAAVHAARTIATVDWDMLGDLLVTRITRLWRNPKNRLCEQYCLRATRSGIYPDVRRGITYLNRDDVWKYGESVKGPGRYAQKFYTLMGLRYDREFQGTKTQCEVVERMKLYNYEYVHGRLPPGNLIRK